MSFRSRTLILPALALIATACADSTSPARSTGPSADPELTANERGMFHRFVSIGTSISMGWQSDGAIGTAQAQSWTAQLAQLADREQSLPLIAFPGCRSPLRAPLGTGARLSGEGAGQNPLTLTCAPNEDGVTLPAQNVSVASARTSEVLTATPESKAGTEYGPLYGRILAPGTTQLQAALSQKPKFISVELGGNEVLGARSGEAARIGFAYMALDGLYGRPDIKFVYSTQALLGSPVPYGVAISLDGIHPSQAGHTILAAAAAGAINTRYGTSFPATAAQIALR